MSFLETLGGHKQPKPIHHYHMHYYHLPVPVIVPKSLPPPKIEIDLLHRQTAAFIATLFACASALYRQISLYLHVRGRTQSMSRFMFLLYSSHDQLRSLSWASHDYRKTLDPEIILSSPHTESSWSSPLPDTWPDSSSLQQKSWAWDNNDLLGESSCLNFSWSALFQLIGISSLCINVEHL